MKKEEGKIAMGTQPYKLLIGGTWRAGDAESIGVLDKFSLEPFASVTGASREQIAQMVDAAHAAFRQDAPVAYERTPVATATTGEAG